MDTSLSTTVTISMDDDKPIIVSYEIPGVGFIKYYIAQKVDGDNAGSTDDDNTDDNGDDNEDGGDSGGVGQTSNNIDAEIAKYFKCAVDDADSTNSRNMLELKKTVDILALELTHLALKEFGGSL